MAISAHNPPPTQGSDALIGQLEALRAEIADQPQRHAPSLRQIPDASRPSAENLLHYLALRSHELGALQDGLAQLGLSSLGRSEPHVLATIDAVLHNLYLLRGHPMPQSGAGTAPLSFENGVVRLERNTEALLGSPPTGRRVRIMVTMPAEAADDYLTLHRLLQRGMDCIRINCAHDGPEQWEGMIRHLRYAERVTGRRCRVLMDLGGPKLRTGPMEPEPAVLKVRPQRDSHGQILRPARIWLTAGEAEPCEAAAADACLSVDPAWLAKIAAGDRIRFRDARKSRRNWRVREASPKGCWVEARKTAYLVNGTVLRLRGKVSGNDGETPLSEIPPQASVIRLRSGDTLLMRASERPGHPASFDDSGAQLSPGSVSLPIPEIYRDARPGESVCFDDGRISGIIEKVEPEKLHIRITHTRKPTERLASDKGVNFPETHLRLPALSEKDLTDLEFAGRHADMIGLSFTNEPSDVRELRQRLLDMGSDTVGIVAKIETRRGFANLPAILLECMSFPCCGVMIARGDLASECGLERMAEVQEEILWLSEAAHVPVIWATQVLEGLTKRGHASRAEITDAAMSQTAECVMLNKGPHLPEAVRMLDDILQRMQGHHSKKRSMLRKLHVAAEFGPAEAD